MVNQFNLSSKFSRLNLSQSRAKQKGAALILMAFILALVATAFVLKTYNADNAKAQQDEKTYKALGEAKQALIAWAVNHPNTPGLMPYPDRNGDGNYDDKSDCYASNVNFSPSFTIGRLPLFNSDPNCVNTKNLVTTGLTSDIRDGLGERLWYEVSKNLLHDYKNNGDPAGTSPIINPSIVNNPSNPWFVVRDRNGNVISNRVAAVIIASGAPIGVQDRSSGIADASQYLDKIVMASGTTFKNYTYQDYPAVTPIQEFIIGDDARVVSKNDPTYKNQSIEPYYYNDKIVYITIDELMYALEKRVAMEARKALKDYSTSNSGNLPNAAGLNLATNSCIKGNLQGLLPTDSATNYSCSCTNSKSCSCNFAGISALKYTRLTGVYGSSGVALPTGACSLENGNKTCACKGAGTCKSSSGLTTQFSCDACGVCTSSNAVVGAFQFIAKGSFSGSSNGCSGAGNSVDCSGILAGTFAVDACTDPPFNSLTTNSMLPTWFTANQWERFVYYDATPNLMVGSKLGIQSIIVTMGAPIVSAPFAASKGATQVTPSCSLNDYLDSVENTNGDNAYEATNKQKTSSYNDQLFIVVP